MITYFDFISLQTLIGDNAVSVFKDTVEGIYCYRMPDQSRYVFDFEYKCISFYTPGTYTACQTLQVK